MSLSSIENSLPTTLGAQAAQARSESGNERRLLTFWRSFAFAALLAGAPVISLAAIAMVDRARTVTEKAFEQRVAEAETAIGRLAEMAELAGPKLYQLQQQAAGNLAELAHLKMEIGTLSKTQSPLLARLDRHQTDLVVRIDTLRNEAASDRAQLEQLQTQTATLSQAQVSLAAALENQKRDFVSLANRMRQEAVDERTDLARLKDQVKKRSDFLPVIAELVSQQQKDLIEKVAQLRQEVLASGASLSLLEGRLDEFMPTTSSQALVRAGEVETAAVGPPSESFVKLAIDGLESSPKTQAVSVPASPAIATPPAARTVVEDRPNKPAIATPKPVVKKVARLGEAKPAAKPKLDLALRRGVPVSLDKTGETLEDALKPRAIIAKPDATQPKPVMTAFPSVPEPNASPPQRAPERQLILGPPPSSKEPSSSQTATGDAAAGSAVPAQAERRLKASAGCTRYKSYNAQTQTYRGYDGVVRPCRAQAELRADRQGPVIVPPLPSADWHAF